MHAGSTTLSEYGVTVKQPTSQPGGTRVDIQWLRALAVGLVVLYHFWPSRIPGGFIGVDVFFVISGYLMTAHLLRHPPRRFYDLAAFWGRRVRRLLPAAFTVIIVVMVLVLLIGPSTQWEANGRGAAASAAYIANWELAKQSVDYLAASDPATAFQHYWSLSVEEQFYLLWPILILVAGLIAARTKHRLRAVAGVGVAVVVAASFAWSVYDTGSSPSQAYFVTTTRLWELAAGGVIAVGYPVLSRWFAGRAVVQLAVVAAGVALIIWSALTLTGANFPGWVAGIPVAGAAAVIAVGPANNKLSFDTVLKWRPFQLLGDISYSVYLWHWPAVVILPWALGHAPAWPVKLATIAGVLVVSWASKTFIEDRFRGARPLGVPLRRTFIFLLIGMTVTAGTGLGAVAVTRATMDNQAIIDTPPTSAATSPAASAVSTASQSATNSPTPATSAPPDCIGAQMLLNPACQGQDVHGPKLLMTPVQAQNDKSSAYGNNCRWLAAYPQKFPICTAGLDGATTQIALFGNSHANPYFDPLKAIVDDNGWSLRTYLASNCFPTTQNTGLFTKPAAVKGCLDFTKNAISDMKAHNTKLVIMSSRAPGNNLVPLYSQVFDQLVAAGIKVLVIRDVPMMNRTTNAPDCVAMHAKNLAACDGPKSQRLQTDPEYQAAKASSHPEVTTADFTNAYCDKTTCYSVVGGIIVYFDWQHLTSTFAKTLRQPLEQAINGALS